MGSEKGQGTYSHRKDKDRSREHVLKVPGRGASDTLIVDKEIMGRDFQTSLHAEGSPLPLALPSSPSWPLSSSLISSSWSSLGPHHHCPPVNLPPQQGRLPRPQNPVFTVVSSFLREVLVCSSFDLSFFVSACLLCFFLILPMLSSKESTCHFIWVSSFSGACRSSPLIFPGLEEDPPAHS